MNQKYRMARRPWRADDYEKGRRRLCDCRACAGRDVENGGGGNFGPGDNFMGGSVMDIEQYNPKKDPKYIGYIFRFLKKKPNCSKLQELIRELLSLKMGSAGISAGLLKTVLETLLAAGFITAPKKLRHFVLLKPLKQRWLPKLNGTNTNVSEGVH